MQVLGVPKSDKNSASCRIRYYAFLSAMGCEYTPKLASADVVYIQKRIDEDTIKLAKKARKRGVPVVFDKDDIKKAWDKKYDKMFSYVSAITTDTYPRAKLISEHTDKPVCVVPDCIDYGIKPEDRAILSDTVDSVVTYGQWPSILAAGPYLKVVNGWYISDRVLDIKAKFVAWNRGTFVNCLKQHDIVFLTHKLGGFGAQYKSANRLVTAMALGIPAITTDSPAYKEVLNDAGHGSLIVSNVKEFMAQTMEMKDISSRRMIGEEFYKYAWDNFAPEKSAMKLKEVFQTCMEER